MGLDDYEEFIDKFKGLKLWWSPRKIGPSTVSYYPPNDHERFFMLTGHLRHRDVVKGPQLKHVLGEGKDLAHGAGNKAGDYQGPRMFTEVKDYYASIRKAWKQGYVLQRSPAPPGGRTSLRWRDNGQSPGLLHDFELMMAKGNAELRRLLMNTACKSIIVVEDINSLLDLMGQRMAQSKDEANKELKDGGISDGSRVTLSELLNMIDGIWSGSEGEKIIVFTPNIVDNLNPALISGGGWTSTWSCRIAAGLRPSRFLPGTAGVSEISGSLPTSRACWRRST
ncbi:AAA-ATPase ASD, mitochondrial-like [Eucalyptus grandis]|uniref:AAA-ATPase ASD, mitochondrial-like n=1 Tax=Eucalyptus grandis TaxID=71139 RepID=UPI00192EF165|nr:AAA-ATPase ASD, mitochondrial-like [Eucalyptus grandis]